MAPSAAEVPAEVTSPKASGGFAIFDLPGVALLATPTPTPPTPRMGRVSRSCTRTSVGGGHVSKRALRVVTMNPPPPG